jgi:hypothetical protein
MNEITLHIKTRKVKFFILKLKLYFLIIFKNKHVETFIENEFKNNSCKYIKVKTESSKN